MYLVLSVASIVSVFPLYYMFCASTNKSIDVIAGKLIPGTYLIENFKALIANQNLGLALWNSFRNATVLTILCLLVCSIAGYGFEIYHDKGKDVVLLVPGQLVGRLLGCGAGLRDAVQLGVHQIGLKDLILQPDSVIVLGDLASMSLSA